jgi:hypothetical protein
MRFCRRACARFNGRASQHADTRSFAQRRAFAPLLVDSMGIEWIRTRPIPSTTGPVHSYILNADVEGGSVSPFSLIDVSRLIGRHTPVKRRNSSPPPKRARRSQSRTTKSGSTGKPRAALPDRHHYSGHADFVRHAARHSRTKQLLATANACSIFQI